MDNYLMTNEYLNKLMGSAKKVLDGIHLSKDEAHELSEFRQIALKSGRYILHTNTKFNGQHLYKITGITGLFTLGELNNEVFKLL